MRACAGIRRSVRLAVTIIGLAMWAGLIVGVCFLVAFVLNP